MLTRLVARQAEKQFAYEDRIADLRAQVDRITSRQLLDQDQFEQRLAQMAPEGRWKRTSALVGLPDVVDRLDQARPCRPARAGRTRRRPRRSVTPSSSSRRPTAKRG